MMFALLQIEWWAVTIAAAISLAIGFGWYSPALLGEKWMKLVKVKPEKDQLAQCLVGGYIISLLQAYGLALVLEHFNALDYAPAIQVAFVISFVFLVSQLMGAVLWLKKPIKAFYIEAGCVLFTFCVLGAFYAYIA